MKRTSHSYIVVMEDHGKLGLEAVVQPEITRLGVVDRIRAGEYKDIVFIHHVDGLFVEDITDDLLREAEAFPANDRPNCYSRVRASMVERVA